MTKRRQSPTIVAAQERTAQIEAQIRHEQELNKRERAFKNRYQQRQLSHEKQLADAEEKRLKIGKKASYGDVTRRWDATSEMARTGITVWRFLKPLMIVFLFIIIVLGFGLSALEHLLVSIGWWWIGFVLLGVLFLK